MMSKARAAITVTVFGFAASPLVALQYGTSLGLSVGAAFTAVGIALCPHRGA